MKKLNIVSLLLTILLLSGISYSQDSVHSGILHTTSTGEENNLVKIHCDALEDQTLESIILDEYAKYSKQISSVQVDAVHRKIYIKHDNSISVNMLLGIMERIHLDVYYLDSNGNQIRFVKTGSENFKR